MACSSRTAPIVVVVAALLLLPARVSGQQAGVQPGRRPAAPPAAPVPPANGLARVAPDLGLPPLPLIGSGSRRDSLRDADRFLVAPTSADSAAFSHTATLVDAVLGADVTGTGFDEYFQYQVPPGYAPTDAAVPLLIAYHGFGGSAGSVSLQSLLDEHCALRGWFYVAPTGLDDQLFGTAAADRHVDAVVQWMLDEFRIDPDRLYMVGFSMGAGVVSNYAARHRDPEGVMIAGLGLVSGAYDWAMSYKLDPAVQPWMVNPYNFGGSPLAVPFAYQSEAVLFFDPASYPPTPGTLLTDLCLVNNLGGTPTYVTWDVGDSVTYLPAQSSRLVDRLKLLGTRLKVRPVSGTVNPVNGTPATHSWAVLDEIELFHFLDGQRVTRRPASFELMFAEDGRGAFAEVQQLAAGSFTRLAARAHRDTKTLVLDWSENAAVVNLDLVQAELGGVCPVHIQAHHAGPQELVLGLRDDEALPGFLTNAATGELVTGAEWDAEERIISVVVAPGTTLGLRAECPPWGTTLTMSPDPVALGGALEVRIGAPAASGAIFWAVLSSTEMLFPIPGGKLLAISPLPPATILPLALELDGTLELHVTIPSDPLLSGARLSFQGAVYAPGIGFLDTSNPVALDIH